MAEQPFGLVSTFVALSCCTGGVRGGTTSGCTGEAWLEAHQPGTVFKVRQAHAPPPPRRYRTAARGRLANSSHWGGKAPPRPPPAGPQQQVYLSALSNQHRDSDSLHIDQDNAAGLADKRIFEARLLEKHIMTEDEVAESRLSARSSVSMAARVRALVHVLRQQAMVMGGRG